MKTVIQRVTSSHVNVNQQTIASIKKGLLVLVGIHRNDTKKDGDYMIDKILKLRIFSDENGFMNKNVVDAQGEILLVSQFTLYADCKKGNRPSFINAMPSKMAQEFYQNFVERFKTKYGSVQTGLFGADMHVFLINDGPVTLVLESG